MIIKIILIIGFLLMLFNLFNALQLRSRASGGIIGSRLVQLIVFIGLFAAGYLVIGILTWNQLMTTTLVIMSLILAFGALFVLLVLRLVDAIITAFTE